MKNKGRFKMLLCKNVIVNNRRTSMRLDNETWQALRDICRKENISLSDLCSLIDSNRGLAGLSSSTRLFTLAYFRRSLAEYEKQGQPAYKSRLYDTLNFMG